MCRIDPLVHLKTNNLLCCPFCRARLDSFETPNDPDNNLLALDPEGNIQLWENGVSMAPLRNEHLYKDLSQCGQCKAIFETETRTGFGYIKSIRTLAQ